MGSWSLELQALPSDHRLFELARDEDMVERICFFPSILVSAFNDGSWDPDLEPLNVEARRLVDTSRDTVVHDVDVGRVYDVLFFLISPERREVGYREHAWDVEGQHCAALFGTQTIGDATNVFSIPVRYLPPHEVKACAAALRDVDLYTFPALFRELRERHYARDERGAHEFRGSRDDLLWATEALAKLRHFYDIVQMREAAVMFTLG